MGRDSIITLKLRPAGQKGVSQSKTLEGVFQQMEQPVEST